MRRFRYLLEAAGFFVVLAGLRRLSPEAASNLGGWLARTLGPRMRVSERARSNLRLALPELSEAEHSRIIRAMWENLGRVMAEYPHLGPITDPASGRVELHNVEPVLALRGGTAGILASAHLANWEIMPVTAAQNGVDMTVIVRVPNNPYVRNALDAMRGVAGGGRTPKGRGGAREAFNVLRSGRVLGLLFDQKLNDGIMVPLFGIDAMTTPAPAQLALRFGCPLIPVRIERTGPARFRVSAQSPLDLPNTGDKQTDIETLTKRLNDILEGWIRERPEQWLWLHRRWPDRAYEEMAAKGRRA
jgi:KDO2-lipid IV(A) lauroyltransferase